MNKKQKNKKSINQINRNRLINKRYVTTIRNLSKLLKEKLKIYHQSKDISLQTEIKEFIKKNMSILISILDKAVKKNVLHKNNAARKKSTVMKSCAKI
jgi:small subunit ribosomal protein S20